MTPQTQNVTEPTEPGTSKGTPATPPVTTPPPVSPQPTASPPGLDPQVYAPDGKMWKEKFHGREGVVSSLKKDKAKTEGLLSHEKETYQSTMQQKEAEVSKLQTTIQEYQGQIDAIPALREQLKDLEKQAGLAAKLRMMAEFPNLLAVQVDQEVPGEEGEEPTVVKVNPLLNLIETSNLEGDALRQQITLLAGAYQGQQPIMTPAGEGETPPPPAPPSPAQPAEGDRAYWYKRAMDLKEKLGEGEDVWEDHRDAWAKVREFDAPG